MKITANVDENGRPDSIPTINVLFTGDFFPGGRIERLMQAKNFEGIYNDFLSVIRDCDVSVTNLEAAITEDGSPIHKTGPTIRAPIHTIEALKFSGFNVVTLANNHIFDYGVHGLKKTMDICQKNGISYVGAGLDAIEAEKPLIKTVKGRKIAFINVAENEFSTNDGSGPGANPLDPILNHYAIKDARRHADMVFVVVHGGHEGFTLPSPRMQKTYRFFIDSGANAVISHHSHCYSGYEIYRGAPIFYGLGNFIFDSDSHRGDEWNNGFAVRFAIESTNLQFSLIPYLQNDDRPGVVRLGEIETERFFEKIEERNRIIQDKERLAFAFEQLCDSRRLAYESNFEPYKSKILHIARKRGWLPTWLSRSKRIRLLNLIRCEAHRDVLLSVFRQRVR